MTFRPEILRRIGTAWSAPGAGLTSTSRLREQINDLYRIEIRTLREVAAQVSSRSTISPSTSWSCAAATSFFLFRSKTGSAIEPPIALT